MKLDAEDCYGALPEGECCNTCSDVLYVPWIFLTDCSQRFWNHNAPLDSRSVLFPK